MLTHLSTKKYFGITDHTILPGHLEKEPIAAARSRSYDEDGFMEEYLVWMQNIIRAFHRQSACVVAYRLLKEEVRTSMAGDQSTLMGLYLDRLIEALDTGM